VSKNRQFIFLKPETRNQLFDFQKKRNQFDF